MWSFMIWNWSGGAIHELHMQALKITSYTVCNAVILWHTYIRRLSCCKKLFLLPMPNIKGRHQSLNTSHIVCMHASYILDIHTYFNCWSPVSNIRMYSLWGEHCWKEVNGTDHVWHPKGASVYTSTIATDDSKWVC